jgi:hypothetical protein
MTPALLTRARHRVPAALTAASGVLAACAFIAACGSATPGSSAPATATTSSTTAAASSSPATSSATASPAGSSAAPTTAAAATASGCLASGLQAQLGVSQGTAGTIYQVIVLTNTSGSPCTLYGYPGVSFVTAVGGTQVGAPAAKNPAVAPAVLTLAPGEKVNTLLALHDAGAFGNCKLTNVDWLKIYPPGDYGSLYVQYRAQTCANPAKAIMTVTAVSAGAGSAS